MCVAVSDKRCILFTNRFSELIPALAEAANLVCIVHPQEPIQQVTDLKSHCPAEVDLIPYNAGESLALAAALLRYRPQLLITYAFQHILSEHLLALCPGINLHPSLLPAYPGLNPWGKQMRDGVTEGGYTIHRLSPHADSGEILAQRTYRFPEQVSDLLHLRDTSLQQCGIPLLLHTISASHQL